MNEKTNKQTNERTNKWTNEQKSPVFYRTSSLLGPLPKKQLKRQFSHFPTRADGQTDQWTDKASNRVACPQLKTSQELSKEFAFKEVSTFKLNSSFPWYHPAMIWLQFCVNISIKTMCWLGRFDDGFDKLEKRGARVGWMAECAALWLLRQSIKEYVLVGVYKMSSNIFPCKIIHWFLSVWIHWKVPGPVSHQ